MLKARKSKKWISIVVTLVFLFSLLPAGVALAADPVKFTNTSKSGLNKPSETGQALGWIKLSEIDKCDEVYVTVELPKDVEFVDTNPTDNINDYIVGADTVGAAVYASSVKSGDKNDYTVVFDTDSLFDGDGDRADAFIRIKFDTDASKVIIKGGASNEILVKVTAKGVEAGSKIWEISKEVKVGVTGDKPFYVEADTPKTISVGSGKEIAEITIEESGAKTLYSGDKIILTLPSGIEWDTSNGTDGWLENGSYGLEGVIDSVSDDELVIRVTNQSSVFGDKLTLNGLVKVFPDADEGDVEVEVTTELDANSPADFDDTTIIVAKIGESDAEVTVEDTADDDIYPGSYNKEIDTITLESSGTFSDGDKVTLTLPKGFVWYLDSYSLPSGVKELVGTYNDDRSVWFELDGSTDEIEFKDLTIAALPDAPLGDIVVTVGGDFDGEAVVGECIARATVSAEKVRVSLDSLDQAAGNIIIKEAKKGAFDKSGDRSLILELPTGVTFAKNPKFEINGSEKGTIQSDTGKGYGKVEVRFNSGDISDSKLETIEISDLKYDLDSRVRASDITVEIYGSLVNALGSADNDVVDDITDYGDDAVLTVVNATAASVTQRTATFVIGSSTYTVNGTEYSMDVAAYVKDGRTYLPVRYVAYALGVDPENIFYDAATQTVTLLKGTTAVQLTIGSNVLKVNGISLTMDVAPEIVSGRTMLPFRFIAQALGASVGYDEATQTVTMDLE